MIMIQTQITQFATAAPQGTAVARDSDKGNESLSGTLELKDLSKIYPSKKGDFKAVYRTNLVIEPGKFVTLLGPSGCGKTTTLRMIAGFEQPSEGDILLDDKSIIDMTADKRPMSMVFQSYALFPHLTVRGNVEFGLKIAKLSKDERNGKVDHALDMMGIKQYADRYPHQLSGGQQQRVALARALVMEPKIILFDEPLSNLDARLRVKMRGEIRDLQQKLKLTAIFVTHDQSEALTMSDVIVVMSAGKVEQVGTPWGIYHRPVNRFVAAFLGTGGFIKGHVTSVLDSSSVDAGSGASSSELPPAALYRLATSVGDLVVHGVPGQNVGDDMDIVVRAENLVVKAAGDSQNEADDSPAQDMQNAQGEQSAADFGGEYNDTIRAKVVSSAFDGEVVHYQIQTDAGVLTGSGPGSDAPLGAGTDVTCTLKTQALWAVPCDRSDE
ncbi:ABC transporter related protein [Bifidobacterium mongoliense DSM 21395]|uniref:ABC transporter related protein n=2 Tax=Bifidobacterium mongoliense TaxID=518643 RepID=A0A087BVJ6_9BIFI|nr:ABC transporter related protein [Bifidobacterium mongoliense DSM 21395]